jgi:hypothetical protein
MNCAAFSTPAFRTALTTSPPTRFAISGIVTPTNSSVTSGEFCEHLSGDPQFHVNVGTDRKVPPLIQILCRPVFDPAALQDVALFRQQVCPGRVGIRGRPGEQTFGGSPHDIHRSGPCAIRSLPEAVRGCHLPLLQEQHCASTDATARYTGRHGQGPLLHRQRRSLLRMGIHMDAASPQFRTARHVDARRGRHPSPTCIFAGLTCRRWRLWGWRLFQHRCCGG